MAGERETDLFLDNRNTKAGYNGSSITANGENHAFLYSGGTMLDLNNLANAAANGWASIVVKGINDSGKIVGTGITNSGQYRAFLLTPDPISPVPIPGTALLLGSALVGITGIRRKKVD